MNNEIIQANIDVHTAMADSYNNEPHFRPENQEKVKKKLRQLRAQSGEKLLDLGCGTGFIIHLAADLFDEIHGVDVTQAMMDKINKSLGYIILHNTPAQKLPFENEYFDAVTAYSFIHHLDDYIPVLQEAYRVLKPGGAVYIDLEPNKLYWDAIIGLEKQRGNNHLNEMVIKEIDSVLHTDDFVEKQFGIKKEMFNNAEYIKNKLGGIDPHQFKEDCLNTGFKKCEFRFEWFLGQGKVMHGHSMHDAQIIEQYLHRISPLSNHLFKYLRFDLVK